MNTLLKGSVLIFYLIALSSPFVSALTPYSRILLIIFGVLVLGHIGEYIVVRKRLEQIPADGAGHLVSTLLFGFVYWAPVLKSNAK